MASIHNFAPAGLIYFRRYPAVTRAKRPLHRRLFIITPLRGEPVVSTVLRLTA
ncbi:MAG: hypothetical protein LBP75_06285 [Planctomycetota bacterium]|nr:hypothetical protein [Planctomycetota bacterium]